MQNDIFDSFATADLVALAETIKVRLTHTRQRSWIAYYTLKINIFDWVMCDVDEKWLSAGTTHSVNRESLLRILN